MPAGELIIPLPVPVVPAWQVSTPATQLSKPVKTLLSLTSLPQARMKFPEESNLSIRLKLELAT